jgi:hypothetical protein
MTTHNPPSDALHTHAPDCVGHCVGTVSETTPRAPSETTASDRPLPYGGRHSQRAPLTASATTASTASSTPSNTPGTTWLITDRTRPFWQHLRNLLVSDNDWHHRDQVITLGKTHGLAERTVVNLLPRAGRRGWLERHQAHVRIRDRAALDAALAMDGGER